MDYFLRLSLEIKLPGPAPQTIFFVVALHRIRLPGCTPKCRNWANWWGALKHIHMTSPGTYAEIAFGVIETIVEEAQRLEPERQTAQRYYLYAAQRHSAQRH